MGLMQGNKGIIGKGDNALDPDKHFDVIVLMLEPPAYMPTLPIYAVVYRFFKSSTAYRF
jgi:hypothetical protein